MMNRRQPASKAAQLDALYAEVPTIECRGLCYTSCGPIEMSHAESRRVAAAGVTIDNHSFLRDGLMDCPALTILKRCAVYEVRPLICRLWGVAESLPCTYGCKPDRYLTDAQAYQLIARAMEISGQHEDAARFREGASPENRAAFEAARRRVNELAELKLRALRRERGTS